ncbi:hypothetical protein DMB91_08605 [Campylobacter sp. MIT 97-5078]|nr:hypothetical protein LR59_13130 [Campylobacter sp. MIT 97-5078]TQR22804.1 hypothetical protein DMB91_08605 [Campylobacter sp. MIT 97-5078]
MFDENEKASCFKFKKRSLIKFCRKLCNWTRNNKKNILAKNLTNSKVLLCIAVKECLLRLINSLAFL